MEPVILSDIIMSIESHHSLYVYVYFKCLFHFDLRQAVSFLFYRLK